MRTVRFHIVDMREPGTENTNDGTFGEMRNEEPTNQA